MKRIKLFCLTLILFSMLSPVQAETITYKKLEGIYYNLTVNNQTTSNYVTMFYLNDRVAYCIEPGKGIHTKEYIAYNNFDKTGLSDAQKELIEKIGYYGYEYPGHQTDKYYIATQELIWTTFSNVNIYWTTGENGTGSTIDITKEKNEILELVNTKSPSFENETIIGYTGETFTIIDTNEVLSNYELEDSKYHDVKVEGNKLIITFNEEIVPEEEIKLNFKKYDNATTLVYMEEGSQNLASLRLSNDYSLTIKLKNQEKIIPEEYEIVKVPNTGDSIIRHFNVAYFGFNNDKRFNWGHSLHYDDYSKSD